MSSTGVPSMASSPRTKSDAPWIRFNSTVVMAMGLGRCRARWANMPMTGMSDRSRGRRFKCVTASNCASWRKNTTTTCENCSSPRKPSASSGRSWISDTTRPHSSSREAVTPFLTTPIGSSTSVICAARVSSSEARFAQPHRVRGEPAATDGGPHDQPRRHQDEVLDDVLTFERGGMRERDEGLLREEEERQDGAGHLEEEEGQRDPEEPPGQQADSDQRLPGCQQRQ